MTNSYKKHPRSGDEKDKFFKNYYNRRLRRNRYELFQGNSFKKFNSHYCICDYEYFMTFEEWWDMKVTQWHNWHSHMGRPYPDRDKEYREWYKWHCAK